MTYQMQIAKCLNIEIPKIITETILMITWIDVSYH